MGLFRKAMEAEKSGGIAFIDGNFEVAGGVEGGQFFAFRYIGIGFGDAVDHFVAFENDAETTAFSLFFKLFAGNIDNYVFKMVYEDDLSLYPIAAKSGAERIFSI